MNEPKTSDVDLSFQYVLSRCISSLEMDDETDIQLLRILSKTVVTLSPTENSVDQALTDIGELAQNRAECGG